MQQQQGPAGEIPGIPVAFSRPGQPPWLARAVLGPSAAALSPAGWGCRALGLVLGGLRAASLGLGPAAAAGSAAAASLLGSGSMGRSRQAGPPAATEAVPFGAQPASVLLGLLLVGWLLLAPGWLAPAWAAELKVSAVSLEPCPAADAGSQPELRRPSGASCYALRGEVNNPGRQPVVDTDVFALILDSSGEPVLPNRSRVGSIGDVPPGVSRFALRLAIPAGTPGPFRVRNPRARGFSAPVRSRAGEGQELLPLEQELAAS